MRVPYAPSSPPENASEETQAIYTRIAARRHPRPLIPLDLALLHNPAIADGYNTLLGAIRTATTVPANLLELSICYIAVLNGAAYEWNAHAPLALKAGVSKEALKAVLEGNVGREGPGGVLREVERDVLEFTRQSTLGVKVGDEVFGRVREALGERGLVELTAAVAGYNMVSRFLVALDVTESNGKEMKVPEV